MTISIDQECPACGEQIEKVTKNPEPRDVMVCIHCGAMSEFGIGMRVSLVPDEESRTNPELDLARKIQQQIRARRGCQ